MVLCHVIEVVLDTSFFSLSSSLRSSNSRALKIAGLTTLACLLLASQVFTAYMVFSQKEQIHSLQKSSEKMDKQLTRSANGKRKHWRPVDRTGWSDYKRHCDLSQTGRGCKELRRREGSESYLKEHDPQVGQRSERFRDEGGRGVSCMLH